MKVKILDATKAEKGSVDLPNQFNEPIRPDLIKRAVLAIQNNKRQAYGTAPRAGLRQSAEVSKRRRDFKGCYGFGISRTPRKIFSRSGTRFNWEGAIAPNTTGGRRAHPPKAEKIWDQKINKRERRKAIRSAITCTIINNIVSARGHKITDAYPFILDSKIEEFNKTKDVVNALTKLGFEDELKRVSVKKIRAGRGKSRGRKYKKKTGPLIVVGDDCNLIKAANNVPGVDVEVVKNINCELLAPGCMPGRLTLWTSSAIEKLTKEKLFTDSKKPKIGLKKTEEKKAKLAEKKKPKKAKKEAKAKPAKKQVKPKAEAKSVKKAEPKKETAKPAEKTEAKKEPKAEVKK